MRAAGSTSVAADEAFLKFENSKRRHERTGQQNRSESNTRVKTRRMVSDTERGIQGRMAGDHPYSIATAIRRAWCTCSTYNNYDRSLYLTILNDYALTCTISAHPQRPHPLPGQPRRPQVHRNYISEFHFPLSVLGQPPCLTRLQTALLSEKSNAIRHTQSGLGGAYTSTARWLSHDVNDPRRAATIC